jgi:hypothetical protein
MRIVTTLSIGALSCATLLATPLPPAHASGGDAFTGVWVSTDTDNSHQTLTVRGAGPSQRSVTYYDDVATQACDGAAATIKGAGTLDGDTMTLSGNLRCDAGTRPLLAITVTFEQLTDGTLLDQFGIIWSRA